MLAMFSLFVQKILLTGGLKVSDLQANHYRALLTAAEQLAKEPIVPIDSLIELAKSMPGRLIVDDASNPKYAYLQGLVRQLFIPSTGGYCQGYKVLLFLWESGGQRFPIAFPPRGCFAMRSTMQEVIHYRNWPYKGSACYAIRKK
jgi:hypothetical protein